MYPAIICEALNTNTASRGGGSEPLDLLPVLQVTIIASSPEAVGSLSIMSIKTTSTGVLLRTYIQASLLSTQETNSNAWISPSPSVSIVNVPTLSQCLNVIKKRNSGSEPLLSFLLYESTSSYASASSAERLRPLLSLSGRSD